MEIHCAAMIRDGHHQTPLDTTTPSSDIPKHLKYVYTTMDVHFIGRQLTSFDIVMLWYSRLWITSTLMEMDIMCLTITRRTRIMDAALPNSNGCTHLIEQSQVVTTQWYL